MTLKIFMKVWIAACIFWSGAGLSEGWDLKDARGLKLALADYPQKLKPWVEQELQARDPEKEPLLWLRAFITRLAVTENAYNLPGLENQLRQAITLAEKNQHWDEMIDLKDTLLWYEVHQNRLDAESITQRSQAIFAEAGRQRLQTKQAMLMASFASYLRETGQMQDAVKLLHEANAQLGRASDATDLDRLNMKNTMALILGYQGQRDKALALYREALELCKKLKVRSLQATIQYNVGKSLIDMDEADKIHEGGQLLLDALKLTEQIDESASSGALWSGVGIYYRKTGQFEKSFAAGKKAIDIFTRQDDKEWAADSYKKLGISYLEAKRFNMAVDALSQALKVSPAEYKHDHTQMLQLLAEAQAGMGHFEEAYRNLSAHVAKYKELAADKEQSDYSKMMVGLGLQVEEEKNRTLSAENELQNIKLQETERLRIIMFVMLALSLLVIGAMYVAIRRSLQVRESKLKMQRILDNIDEGILSINKDFQIEPDYSRHLKSLLGGDDFTYRDAISELFAASNLPADTRSMVRETLKVSIGEDNLNWETNSHLLPHEVHYPGPEPRYLAFHWQAICGSDGRVATILLGLRDVTARKALEEQIKAAQQRTNRWTLKVAELLQTDVRKVEAVLAQAEEAIKRLDGHATEQDKREALRVLHTVKGVARTIALRILAQASHQLEEVLVQTDSAPDTIAKEILTFKLELADYRQLIDQIFQRETKSAVKASTLSDAVNQSIPPLLERLEKQNTPIQGIDIIDHVLPWSPDLLNRVSEILMHAMNNSIDHGFIFPQEKGQKVKPVHLVIEARQVDHRLQLVVSDNGNGIDQQKLARLAHERGLSAKPHQDVYDLAFMDGVSTALRTTESSGRGVGLSGVRQICAEVGGHAQLSPNPQGGTRLVIDFPLDFAAKTTA